MLLNSSFMIHSTMWRGFDVVSKSVSGNVKAHHRYSLSVTRERLYPFLPQHPLSSSHPLLHLLIDLHHLYRPRSPSQSLLHISIKMSSSPPPRHPNRRLQRQCHPLHRHRQLRLRRVIMFDLSRRMGTACWSRWRWCWPYGCLLWV
jgi:hypothetical protein